MNVQQLEYIIAVDNHRHFAKAAEAVFVTQPTLSMMIQKLERELGVKIFDRTKQPIEPTEIGKTIIAQARITLKDMESIKELVYEDKNIVEGDFKMGIIPTIAAYLIPELIKVHNSSGCKVNLTLLEKTTNEALSELLSNKIDGALVAGPIHLPRLMEYPIYYEKFYLYLSPENELYKEREIDINEIDPSDIWLLEEEHCLRGQIQKICHMRHTVKDSKTVHYDAGSLDTLIHVIDVNGGMTVIPEMMAMDLPEETQENLRKMSNDESVREICLVVNKEYPRQLILKEIIDLIKKTVPKSMQEEELSRFVVGIEAPVINK